MKIHAILIPVFLWMFTPTIEWISPVHRDLIAHPKIPFWIGLWGLAVPAQCPISLKRLSTGLYGWTKSWLTGTKWQPQKPARCSHGRYTEKKNRREETEKRRLGSLYVPVLEGERTENM